MRYERFDDIAAFRERAEPFLLVHEAQHGLLLSVIASWDGIATDAHAGLLVDDNNSVAGVAVRRDWRLLVSRTASTLATEFLADALRKEPAGAILGANDTVEEVASKQGRTITQRLCQGIYENRRVAWPATRPSGRRRVAVAGDEDMLVAFHVALSESIGQPQSNAEARSSVAARIAARAIHVWEDDSRIVSSAAAVGPTLHGIRINLVFTPPEFRRRGFASYLVAELTQELLDAGRSFVFLHTDLANPTSNALYKRIGYERVGDFLMLALTPG
jgi:GNAT superfamily N-acetyltransferase